jgi:hypothetical protein
MQRAVDVPFLEEGAVGVEDGVGDGGSRPEVLDQPPGTDDGVTGQGIRACVLGDGTGGATGVGAHAGERDDEGKDREAARGRLPPGRKGRPTRGQAAQRAKVVARRQTVGLVVIVGRHVGSIL